MATLPAWLVSRVLVPGSAQSVTSMADNLLNLEADRVLLGVDSHLRIAHEVLNGLLAEGASSSPAGQLRLWQDDPVSFETMATVLTRQSPDIAGVFFGDWRGHFMGVEPHASGARVSIRNLASEDRQVFFAGRPGDRDRPQATENRGVEPRIQSWYLRAVEAKSRTFSPLQVAEPRHELLLTLSQPVYDDKGVTTAVVGVDLFLAALTDDLRRQRVSAHAATFIVDEQGILVASSVEDALIREAGQGLVRRSARDSGSPLVRTAFAALESRWAGRVANKTAPDDLMQPSQVDGEEPLWMVQRPYGDALGLRWTLVVVAPQDDFLATLQADLGKAHALLLLFVLGAGVAGWAFAQRIAHTLDRIAMMAQALGDGRTAPPALGSRIGELRALGDSMEDTVWRVQQTHNQLQGDVAALQTSNESLLECTETRTRELAEARIEAQAALRAKATFLAILSHEIRTPLNGVVGMSTLLAETPLDAEQRDYVQTLRLSSAQLLAVINDILDFSRIESAQMELETGPVNLRTLVEEACDIAAPQAREKGLDLLVDMPAAGEDGFPATVIADAARLRQVLINLLQNAIKFTMKGEVAVHMRRLAQDGIPGQATIEFRIIDSGIGIAPDRVKTLFQAFTQVDVSPTRRFSGTGLGLAICKGLVQLMGGQIGVESELEQGSTFWFTLLAPVTEGAPAENPYEAGRLRAGRVLIVHDQAGNVRILRRQLTAWEMEVASAEGSVHAIAGLQAAQERRKLPVGVWAMPAVQGPASRTVTPWLPDVIILDLQVSEMDSVMLARTLKGRPEWADIPLVLLSSGLMPPGSTHARLFEERLLKPARQSQLCDALVRCLMPKRLRAAAAPVEAAGVEPGTRKTVLVVDDIAVNRKVAAAMLVKLGFDVQQATGGRDAVAAVARSVASGSPLAAILMDVNMPQVDGLAATRQIIEAWGKDAPPVIALTAAALPQDEQRCLDAGMVAYLTKPLHVAQLARTLGAWVESAGLWAAAAPAGLQRGDRTGDAAAGAAAPDDGVELMDFSRLEEFREFDDEAQTMIREVVAMFIAEVPQRLAVIEAAVANGDAPALSVAAHALKGASSNIGASALNVLCRRIEEESRESVSDAAPAQVARLHLLWAQTREALAGWK